MSRLDELLTKYEILVHAVQTGIGMLISRGVARMCEPKHLRVGIDMSKAEQGALAELLISKGIFTQEEYYEAMVKGAEREVALYEARCEEELGAKVTLL